MANSHKTVTRADAHPPGEVTASILMDEQGSDPTAPGAGWEFYAKAGGIYARHSGGTIVGPFIDTSSAGVTFLVAQVFD